MESRSGTTIIIALILTGFATVVCGQHWVKTSSGERPPPNMFSGHSVDKYGRTLYVCKAQYRSTDDYVTGQTWTSNGRLASCKRPGSGRMDFPIFYVLTQPPEANYRLDWSAGMCVWRGAPWNGVTTAYQSYVGRKGPPNRFGSVNYIQNAFFYRGDGPGEEHWQKCHFQVLLKHRRKIAHYEVSDVEYDISKASITFANGKISFGSRITQNNSPYETESLVEWSRSVTKTSHWSQTEGIEIYSSIETSFSAGIPEVGELGVSVTVGGSVTVTDTHGESHEVSEAISHSEKVKLPPYSASRIYLFARKANIRIPYTSSVRVVFADGGSVYRHGVKGIYEGTDFFHFEVFITEEPLRN